MREGRRRCRGEKRERRKKKIKKKKWKESGVGRRGEKIKDAKK
jgi:hypothetical protein